MTDGKDLQDCYVFKLSQAPGLAWFTNIVLLSSYQDTYAPF